MRHRGAALFWIAQPTLALAASTPGQQPQSYRLDHPSRRWLLVHFMINTPTIVATVDAALAAAIAVLVLQTAGAATAVMVAGGVVAFLAGWGGLMPLQRHTADPLRRRPPGFPTPPEAP